MVGSDQRMLARVEAYSEMRLFASTLPGRLAWTHFTTFRVLVGGRGVTCSHEHMCVISPANPRLPTALVPSERSRS